MIITGPARSKEVIWYWHSGNGLLPQGSDAAVSRASLMKRTFSTAGRGPHSESKTEGQVNPGYNRRSTKRPFGSLECYLGTYANDVTALRGRVKNNRTSLGIGRRVKNYSKLAM